MATVATLAFPVDNFLGAKFTQVYPAVDATATLEYPGTPFDPGQTVKGSDNSEWVFAKAAGTIVMGDCVIISTMTGGGAAYTATAITDTQARTTNPGNPVGIAGAAATVGQFIWVQRKGFNPSCNVAAGSKGAVIVRTSGANAGQLTTSSVGGASVQIAGLTVYITVASSVGGLVINYPFVSTLD